MIKYIYTSDTHTGEQTGVLILADGDFNDKTLLDMRGKFVSDLRVPAHKEQYAIEFARNLNGMYVGAILKGKITTY